MALFNGYPFAMPLFENRVLKKKKISGNFVQIKIGDCARKV